jgi:hypothetical protein
MGRSRSSSAGMAGCASRPSCSPMAAYDGAGPATTASVESECQLADKDLANEDP